LRPTGEGISLAAQRACALIEPDAYQQFSMLKILHAACVTALDAFRAAANPIDRHLVADLEAMVERTRQELERFANRS
jgi:hypothetical protein